MSTYHEEMKAKFPGRPYVTRPPWELRNMKKALSLMPWMNGPAETQRLREVSLELDERRREGRK